MQRKYIAMVLFTASDWLSVCGWNAVLIRSCTPTILNMSRQMCPVKTGSLSLTIDVGNPCRRTMSLKKALATDEAV
ncbi:hypothetical protein PVAP13_8KG216601 [Panicum virgatum]|uniref:Uncharacterized protein n=1 Tax=Panicum virgatum TaxID=38727 RepID=A0A8T0PHX0_PANVG|nr:hypothetical protein PVAP13_8KG216601 [Panicum virgatum]